MSWLYSRALAAECLAANCLDGELSAQLKSTDTAQVYCSHGKTTEVSDRSRYGMTYEHLTDAHGEALLMSYREAFHAKISALPEKGLASRPNEAVYGEKWYGLSVRFSPDSFGWKMFGALLEEDLHWSCLTLPEWGMMHDGELWGRTRLGLRTEEAEYGFEESEMLPTPNCMDGMSMRSEESLQRGRETGGCSNLKDLPDIRAAGGSVNPEWVEWLMGWPIGWTELKALETGRFRRWLDLHGKY